MGIAKQNTDLKSIKLGLKKRNFWLVVAISLSSIMAFTALYFPYQSTKQYGVNLKNNQEDQRLFQAKIRAEINNQTRADYVEKHQLNLLAQNSIKLEKNTKLPEKNDVENISPPSSNPITSTNLISISGKSSTVKTALTNSNSRWSAEKNTVNNNIESMPFEQITFSKLKLKPSIFDLVTSNELVDFNTNSEFSKKRWCQSIKGFVGANLGTDYLIEERDYSNRIESQISDWHYNLEESTLLSTRYLSFSQYNAGINGGVQLFNRLDIEGGLTLHKSKTELNSIYRNLIKEEYTYVEWVATGESGGPNGQPIYKPQDVTDFYYLMKRDTVNTVANNYQLEVPLLIRYNFKFNKLSLFATLGSSAILYCHYEVNSTNTSTGETSSITNNQFGLVQLNALIGAGISYQLLGGLEIKLEPLFRPVIKSEDEFLPTFKSNSGSLNAGITYRF